MTNNNIDQTLPVLPGKLFWRVTTIGNDVNLELRKKMFAGSRLIDFAPLGKIRSKEIQEDKTMKIKYASEWLMKRNVKVHDTEWLTFVGDYKN